MALTPRRALFCAEYVKDRNGTQAAIRAGFSARSAYSTAERILKSPEVKKEIEKRMLRLANKLEISAERVLAERARLAFFDVRKLMHDDGTPKALADLDDDTAAAIAGLDVESLFDGNDRKRIRIGSILKYKLADKNASLTALEKHLGLYKDGSDGDVPLSIHIHL